MVSDLTYFTVKQGVLSMWPVYNKSTKSHFLDLKGHSSCPSCVVHTLYMRKLWKFSRKRNWIIYPVFPDSQDFQILRQRKAMYGSQVGTTSTRGKRPRGSW